MSTALILVLSNRGSAPAVEPTDLGERIAFKLDKVANAMATAPNDLTSSVISALYHWQGLIGGFFAVAVGLLTIVFTAMAIKAQIDSDDRRYVHDLRLRARAYRLSLRPLAKRVQTEAKSNLDLLNNSVRNAYNSKLSAPYHGMRDAASNTRMPVSETITEQWDKIVVANGLTLDNFLKISDALERFESARAHIIADNKMEDWDKSDKTASYANYLANMTVPLNEIMDLAEQIWNSRT